LSIKRDILERCEFYDIEDAPFAVFHIIFAKIKKFSKTILTNFAGGYNIYVYLYTAMMHFFER